MTCAVALLFSAATVLGMASPAVADHQGGAATEILDTPTWRVCNRGLVDGQLAVVHAIGQVNRTVVSATTVACGGADVNVDVNTASYPDGWYGATGCPGGEYGDYCRAKSVRLNSRTSTTTTQLWKTACHEFGHVAGLGHMFQNDSCLTQGAAPPIVTTLHAHDIQAINATYAAGVSEGRSAEADVPDGPAVLDVDERLPTADPEQLADASDVVVRGRVAAAETGVQIGEDEAVGYTVYTVEVGEALAGAAGDTVDVALLTHLGGSPVSPAGRPTPAVGDEGVWYLTEIAPEFGRDGYVLTNQRGLLLVGDDGSSRR